MKKILLSFTVVLFSISVMAQNNVSLKMNLEKNKVYRFSAVSEQTITQTVNGNQQTVDSRTNYAMSMRMIDATADFMITEVRFDTLISNTNSMGKTTAITSVSEGNIKSAETAEVMSCIMNRLTKNALYVKMDFTGKVLEIVNSKMLAGIMMSDTSSITLTGPLAAAVKTQIKSLVSDNTLKTMVEMYTYNLPGKQVSAGDNWNTTQKTFSGGMALDILTDYHLGKVSGDVAEITAESNIKAAENAIPIESGGAKVTYDDLKGLSKSDLEIDCRTGLLIGNRAKTHISGNLGVSMPGMSMQIPMDINGISKVFALK